MFETKVDLLVSFLQKRRSVGLDMLAKHLQMPVETTELICAILEKGGIVDVNYPSN